MPLPRLMGISLTEICLVVNECNNDSAKDSDQRHGVESDGRLRMKSDAAMPRHWRSSYEEAITKPLSMKNRSTARGSFRTMPPDWRLGKPRPPRAKTIHNFEMSLRCKRLMVSQRLFGNF